MVSELLPIVFMIIVAVGLAAVILILSSLLGPRRPEAVKLSPYESGMEPFGEAHQRFSIRFYIIAMLFVIFDIEIIFFYPWAIVYKDFLSLGNFILFEMLVFVAFLLVGYVYAWKKGAFEWD